MPLAGFSEEDPPLALGYYLGLRWFQAVLVNHDQFSLNRDGSMVMMTCGCGAVGRGSDLAHLQEWYDAHRATSAVVLNGARGRWEPGINHAVCGSARRHRVPDRGCGCGFWSYWRLGSQQVATPHIAGLIKGSGKIVKGPLGFRCSQAEILALTVPYGRARVASGNLSDEGTLLALALEETYAPVYGSVGALLEEHQAPGTQPPLGDDWYSRSAQRQSYWATVPAPGSSARSTDAGARAVLCPGCSRVACTPGQAYCAVCEIATANTTAALGALEHYTQAAITGVDALNQLHARRDSWADPVTPQVRHGL